MQIPKNDALMHIFYRLSALFIVFLFSLSSPLVGYSQCDPAIPSNADQKDGTVLHGVSDDTLWLCPGASLDLESSFGSVDDVSVFAEENTTVRVEETDGNDGNIIYIQDGGQVDIGANATNTTVYHNSNVTINDNGSSTSLVDCGTVTYDYSNAPADDCQATSIAETEQGPGSRVKVTSMRDLVRLELPDELIRQGSSLEFQLHDMLGKRVYNRTVDRSQKIIDPDLPGGVYQYTLRKDAQVIVSGKLGLR